MKQKIFITIFMLIVIAGLVFLYKSQTISHPKAISYSPAPEAVVNGSNQEVIIGGKSNLPTVVYTMALGCADCIVLARDLNTVAAEYQNRGVRFYGVDIQSTDSLNILNGWVNSITNPNYITYVVDTNGNFIQKYKVNQLSELYIIDKGEIVYEASEPSANDIQTELSKII